jgi:hypothetical protein
MPTLLQSDHLGFRILVGHAPIALTTICVRSCNDLDYLAEGTNPRKAQHYCIAALPYAGPF